MTKQDKLEILLRVEPDTGFNENELAWLVKKARMITFLRNILISLVISFLVLSAAFWANNYLLTGSGNKAWDEIYLLKQIKGANLFVDNFRANNGFLEGLLEYQTYKMINGIPVIWRKETAEYDVLGNFSILTDTYGVLQAVDPRMPQGNYEAMRTFNYQTGHREIFFYHPAVEYKYYANDLVLLKEIDDRKFMEMAISFNKSYTLEQVKQMLPQDVTPAWYWVDTYEEVGLQGKTTQEEHGIKKKISPSPESADLVYGIHAINNYTGLSKEAQTQDFIRFISEEKETVGKFQGEYQRIYDVLRKGKAKPGPDDVGILGVVVTGSPEELEALEGKSFVKAAVLGVTVEKF